MSWAGATYSKNLRVSSSKLQISASHQQADHQVPWEGHCVGHRNALENLEGPMVSETVERSDLLNKVQIEKDDQYQTAFSRSSCH